MKIKNIVTMSGVTIPDMLAVPATPEGKTGAKSPEQHRKMYSEQTKLYIIIFYQNLLISVKNSERLGLYTN